jgi:hypothetical protein
MGVNANFEEKNFFNIFLNRLHSWILQYFEFQDSFYFIAR